tara:strand:- start:3043 stop:3231 length:189 start_codon:yes stop_codon:yes gene_type:complete
MPRLSIELIKSEYKSFNAQDEHKHFGPYMNEKFFLGDVNLQGELDNNFSLLRLLKDHVQEKL